MSSVDSQREHPTESWFVTTRWTAVLSAQDKEAPKAVEAMETLCRTYWFPLYAFVRRQGHSPHDAQDLTQEFFARLLEKDYLQSAAPEKGRFRTFLLVMLKRFLANEWDRARAQKRGGAQVHVPLDTSVAENRYQTEAGGDLPAEKIYDRRWALALLDHAMARLKREFSEAGKEKDFESLKGVLGLEREGIRYEVLASELGVNEGAARVAAHRLRRRFRTVFREEIAHTVADPGEIDEELRYLLSILSE